MNIFILKAMQYLDNPELFTVAEMWKNADNANAVAASYADYVATANAVAASYADYVATANADAKMWESANNAHAAAATYADYAATAYAPVYADCASYADCTDFWLNKYFKETGEDKQAYINEVERLK